MWIPAVLGSSATANGRRLAANYALKDARFLRYPSEPFLSPVSTSFRSHVCACTANCNGFVRLLIGGGGLGRGRSRGSGLADSCCLDDRTDEVIE
jgi:hypothetical protein